MTFYYGKDQLTVTKTLQILKGEIRATLHENTIARIENSAKIVANIAQGERAVYGINTGFGPLCSTRISSENTSILQKKLLLSHSVGVGNPIDKDIAKTMLILKIQALAKGFSGITMGVISRLLWHLEQDVIPVVPEQGSVGASGDLAPLSHLFLPLLGEGKVIYKGEIYPTQKILQRFALSPLTLEAKEGLALINGTQFIAAHAIQVVDQLENCLFHADLAGAMMVDGLMGSIMPFHPYLHELRPYAGNVYVAQNISKWLAGSEIVDDHKDCDRVQDPYSLRCMPQVHGASRNAWQHLKDMLEIEINSVTDNPKIFSEELTISGGSFHGQPLALPLDYACLAASELGNISDRRTYLSLEGKFHKTPKLLMANAGLDSGFMILQYTSAALASENKTYCFPASADSIMTSLGQEDHVSMGSISARKALKVCKNVNKILAIELLCAAQALDFKKPLRPGKLLRPVHAYIRSRVSHVTEDRIFSEDIEKAIEIVEGRKLREFGA